MPTDLDIPDVSEYQNVDFSTFSGPIIVRAHNGWREDHRWQAHAAGASQQPWWGAYQYLPASVDPAQAARGFLASLGSYRPNVTILDLEEGDGDQQPRQHAWLEVMASDPATDWTYSGLYFARQKLGGSVQWIAAYGQREPTDAHVLWQDTDARFFPGIGTCDGSKFHGSLQDLIALTNPTPASPASTPKGTRKMLCLVKGDKNVQWWFTDFVTKRYAVSVEQVNRVIWTVTSKGGTVGTDNGGPIVLPQADVDAIPTAS